LKKLHSAALKVSKEKDSAAFETLYLILSNAIISRLF